MKTKKSKEELIKELKSKIVPTIEKPGDITYYPCSVKLTNGNTLDCVYFIDKKEYIRHWGDAPKGRYFVDISEIESIPNPKRVLRDILRTATELGTRRRRRFDTNIAVQRIPECIEDFSSLRSLSAFIALEEVLKRTIESQCWDD